MEKFGKPQERKTMSYFIIKLSNGKQFFIKAKSWSDLIPTMKYFKEELGNEIFIEETNFWKILKKLLTNK